MPTVDILRQIAVAFIPPRYLRTPLAAAGSGFADDVAWQSRLASEFCVAPDVIIVEGFGNIRNRPVCPAPDHVHGCCNVFQRAGNLVHTFDREGRLLRRKPYAVGFVKHPLDGGKRFVGIGVLVAQQPLADLCPFAGGNLLNMSAQCFAEQVGNSLTVSGGIFECRLSGRDLPPYLRELFVLCHPRAEGGVKVLKRHCASLSKPVSSLIFFSPRKPSDA